MGPDSHASSQDSSVRGLEPSWSGAVELPGAVKRQGRHPQAEKHRGRDRQLQAEEHHRSWTACPTLREKVARNRILSKKASPLPLPLSLLLRA